MMANFTVHPEWDPRHVHDPYYDVAVAEVDRDFEFEVMSARPVCIYQNQYIEEFDDTIITGCFEI